MRKISVASHPFQMLEVSVYVVALSKGNLLVSFPHYDGEKNKRRIFFAQV